MTNGVDSFEHALNKCIENATKYTFGDQGLGKSTAPQLLYNALTLYTKIRSMGGLKLLDEQFTKVAEKLNTDDEWQKEAKKNSPIAFADRSAKLDHTMRNQLPRNVKRWTMLLRSARSKE